jgi:hypothetical protein
MLRNVKNVNCGLRPQLTFLTHTVKIYWCTHLRIICSVSLCNMPEDDRVNDRNYFPFNILTSVLIMSSVDGYTGCLKKNDPISNNYI